MCTSISIPKENTIVYNYFFQLFNLEIYPSDKIKTFKFFTNYSQFPLTNDRITFQGTAKKSNRTYILFFASQYNL